MAVAIKQKKIGTPRLLVAGWSRNWAERRMERLYRDGKQKRHDDWGETG